jgi:hypothetical protein
MRAELLTLAIVFDTEHPCLVMSEGQYAREWMRNAVYKAA